MIKINVKVYQNILSVVFIILLKNKCLRELYLYVQTIIIIFDK